MEESDIRDLQVPTPEQLRKSRKAVGLTQGELAERAGIAQPTLSQIERGEADTSLRTIRKIVRSIQAEIE